MPDSLSKLIKVVPTIGTSAYASGDVLGTLMTFSYLLRYPQTGRLKTVQITDLAGQSVALDVFLFKSQVTIAGADNAALALADAAVKELVGVVEVAAADYVSAGSGVSFADIQVDRLIRSDSQHLYAQLVSRGTPTYGAATDLEVTLGVMQD